MAVINSLVEHSGVLPPYLSNCLFQMLSIAILGCVALSAGCVYFLKPSLYFIAYMRFSRWRSGVKSKQCQVGKVTWIYSERGQPSPDLASFILVHGYSGSRDAWNWVIKNLPQENHIIAVDLPGHGDTVPDPLEPMHHPIDYYATNLKSFVDKIGLETHPLHLIGLSMGGAVSGVFAALYPSRVKQVSFVCPGMDTPIPSKMHEDEKDSDKGPALIPETPEEQLAVLNKYVVYKPMRFPLQFIRGMQDERRKYIPFMKLLMEQFHKPENEGRLNKVMDKITAPAHIVWGEHDNIVHVSGAQVLKDNLPNVQQYDIFPECGHAVDLEKGELLAQKLTLFWTKYNAKV